MSRRLWLWALPVCALTSGAYAQLAGPGGAPDQSVYALPTPSAEGTEGANTGGVNLDIKVTYLTKYIYRGVNRAEELNPTRPPGEASNYQFDGKLAFNLGKAPHPFIGIFGNVFESDPVSNFQEVRPFFGADWYVRPLALEIGNNTYTFPDRGEAAPGRPAFDTAEAFGKIMLDDSVLFRTDDPVFSPYVYAAYDYDRWNGWYFEAGIKHDFPIEKTGITLTPTAAVSYVLGHGAFADPDDDGFQHYELGLTARYSLNLLLNIAPRFGQWSLNGYLFYSDGIEKRVRADTELWGGAGIEFSY